MGAAAPELPCPRENTDSPISGSPDDDSPVQEAELHPQVLSGHGEDLGRRPDRVVEADAFVPDRVPDRVGDCRHVAPLVVDEHHVEVAVGAELASAVSSDRQEGHTLQVPACGGVRAIHELVVGRMAVGQLQNSRP